MATTKVKKKIILATASTIMRIITWAFATKTIVVCIFGPRGTGKSEIVKSQADLYAGASNTNMLTPDRSGKYDIQSMIDTRLGQLQVEDLTGMPMIISLITNPGDSVFHKGDQISPQMFDQEFYRCRLEGKTPPTREVMTTYAIPSFFPRAHQGKVVWFFDEFNRADRGMHQCMFQVTLDRKYFTYDMPDAVRMVMAGNCTIDEANAMPYFLEDLDPALTSRLVILRYKGPTFNEWRPWAASHSVHDGVISFVGTNDKLLVTEPTEDGLPCPNPRSWKLASDFLKNSDQDYHEAQKAGLAGIIGYDATVLLLDYMEHNYEALPDPRDLSRGLDFVRKCSRKNENDKITSFIGNVADHVGNGGGYTKEALTAFLKGIPQEYSFMLLRSLGSTEHGMQLVSEVMGSGEGSFDEELCQKYERAQEAA